MVQLTMSHFQTFTILAVIFLGILFVMPFLSTLLFAAVLAYLTHPLYLKIKKKLPDTLAAFTVCIALLAILASIVNYGVSFILNEMGSIYLFLSKAQTAVLGPTFNDIFRLIMTKSIAYISEQASVIPSLIVSTFLFFIALFYFLKQGKQIFGTAWRAIPLPPSKREILLKDVRANVDAFVFVTFAIGLVQGLIAAIGFLIFGLSYPFLAAVAAAALSMIPVLGPYLLYVSIALFMFYKGLAGVAVGILLYGLIAGSILDYAARPYLMSKRAKTHPLVVFLGIFGGIHVLGLLGIVVGPIILSVAMTFIKDIHLYGIK